MTVRIAKQPVNLREKLAELERPIGVKGSELMRAETAQDARDLVSAGRKNMVINGDVQVAQRATSASTTGNTFRPVSVDRFSLGATGSNHSIYTAEQSTDAPDGFRYSFKITTTTAAAATTGYQRVNYSIEGYSAAQIGYGKSWAKTVTASFWVKSNNPGTYSVAFTTIGTSSRYFSQVYTINQSDTWEYKTITIPGDTVDVSQNTTNGHGLYAAWALRASSTWTSGTNNNGKWIAQTDSSRHVGHNVDVGNTNGDYWAITGYQVELGSNATEFEHRSYGEELALCQRYYEKSFPDNVTPARGTTTTSLLNGGQPTTTLDWYASFSAGTLATYHYFRVPKRGVPQMTLFGTSDNKCLFFDFGTKSLIYPGLIIDTPTKIGFRSYNNGSGLTNNSSWGVDLFNWTAEAEL